MSENSDDLARRTTFVKYATNRWRKARPIAVVKSVGACSGHAVIRLKIQNAWNACDRGGRGVIMTAEEYMVEAHNELRDDRSDRAIGEVLGAINALHAVGLLPDVQAAMWAKVIQFCPGHDNEGGRSWCAYCGDLPPALTEAGEGEETTDKCPDCGRDLDANDECPWIVAEAGEGEKKK